MWAVVLFALLAGATAYSNQQITNPAWQPDLTLVYRLKARSLTTINDVENQYAGVLTKAEVLVQANKRNHSQAILKVRNPEFAKVNNKLPGGWNANISDSVLNWQPLRLKSSEIVMEMSSPGGAVRNVLISKNSPTWEANLMRSIANALQLNTNPSKTTKNSRYFKKPNPASPHSLYYTWETSPMGWCESQYDSAALPKYILAAQPQLAPKADIGRNTTFIEIFKSTNFSNCKSHELYHTGIFPTNKSDTGENYAGSAISRAVNSRYIIEGNWKKYIIHSAVTIGKIAISPFMYDDQNAESFSMMNLTLIGNSTSSGLSPPSQPQPTTLQYDMVSCDEWNAKQNNDDDSSSSSSSDDSDSDDDDDNDDSSSSSSSSSDDDSNNPNQQQNKNKNKKKQNSNRPSPKSNDLNRFRRSVSPKNQLRRSNNKANDSSSDSSSSSDDDSSSSSSSSSSSDSSSSEEENIPLRAPGLDEATFHPMSLYCAQKAQSQYRKYIPEIAQRIGAQLQDKPGEVSMKNTLSYYLKLVTLVRAAKTSDLQAIAEQVYASPSKTRNNAAIEGWKAFRDALAQAGTPPALKVIHQLISSKKVGPAEGALLIDSLPNSARMPTPAYMDFIFENFVKKFSNVKYVNVSSAMALTNLVRKAAVDRATAKSYYPVDMYKNILPDASRAKKYIAYFAQQLKQASLRDDSHAILVYVRAIGNTAHPEALDALKPIWRYDWNSTVFQRLAATMALKPMARVHPEKARPVLYKLYRNLGEAYEVRTAAAFLLMKTNPPADMLQRMAEYTQHDPSPHVSAVVRSAIKSAAALSNPDQKDFALAAKAAVPMLSNKPLSTHFSRSYLIDDFMNMEENYGYSAGASFIGSRKHIWPKAAFLSYWRILGDLHASSTEYSAMVSSVEKLMSAVWNTTDDDDYDDIFEALGKPKSQNAPWNEFVAAINLGPRNFSEPLEAQFSLPTFGGKKFYAFGPSVFHNLTNMLADLVQQLDETRYINFTKMYIGERMVHAVPDVTGNLMIFTYHTPTLVRAVGKIDGNFSINPSDLPVSNKYGARYANPTLRAIANAPLGNATYAFNAARINASMHLTLAKRRISKVQIVNYYESAGPRVYSANVHQDIMLNLPFVAVAGFNVSKATNRFNITVAPAMNSKTVLFHYSTTPFTAHQSAAVVEPIVPNNGNAKVISIRPPKQVVKELGAFKFNLSTENRFIDFPAFAYSVQDREIGSFFAFPLLYNDIQNTTFRVTYNPSNRIVKNVTFSVHYNSTLNYNKGGKNAYKENLSPNEAANANVTTHVGAAATVNLVGSKQLVYAFNLTYDKNPFSNQNRYNIVLTQAHGSAKNNYGEYNNIIRQAKLNVTEAWADMPRYFFEKAMEENPNSYINAKAAYYGPGGRKAQINGQCKLQRSQARERYVQQHPIAQQCKWQMRSQKNYLTPACRNASFEAAKLDHITCQIEHANWPEAAYNASYSLYSAWRYLFYYNAQENYVNPQSPGSNKLVLSAQFSPNLTSVNVQMRSPRLAANYNNIRLNRAVAAIAVPHANVPAYARVARYYLREAYRPKCALDNSQVVTFSNVTYPIPHLGKCWHTLVTFQQNRSLPYNISIEARDESDSQRAVRILINGQEKIVMSAAYAPPQAKRSSRSGDSNIGVYVDREQIPVSPDQPAALNFSARGFPKPYLLRVSMPHDEAVKLRLVEAGVHTIFDGKRVLVELPTSLRGAVRGLCGQNEHTPAGAIAGPQGYIIRNPKYLVALYANTSSNAQCSGPALQARQQAEREPRIPPNLILYDVVSDSNKPLYAQGSGNSNYGDDDDSSSSSSDDSSSSDSSSSSSDSDSDSSSDDSNSSDSSSSSSDSSSSSSDDSSSESRAQKDQHYNFQNKKNYLRSSNKNNNGNDDNDDNDDSSSDSSDSNDSSSSSSSSSDSNENNNQQGERNKPGKWQNQKGCAQKQVKTVEKPGQTCFSKHLVLTGCDSPCQPAKYTESNVPFHCIENSSTARLFKQQVENGAKPDFSRKSTSFTMKVQHVEACK